MPLRTVTLDDGTVCTRSITNFHPDGAEFLPEEFSLSSGTFSVEEERIYRALERLMNEPPQTE